MIAFAARRDSDAERDSAMSASQIEHTSQLIDAFR
jgi:hypothetical protein